MSTQTASEKAIERIDRYIRARYPIIGVVTHEEERVVTLIKNLVTSVRPDLRSWKPRRILEWSIVRGLRAATDDDPLYTVAAPNETDDPVAVLKVLSDPRVYGVNQPEDKPIPTVVLLYDFHPYLSSDPSGMAAQPLVVRALRELSNYFQTTPHTAVFVSPVFSVPTDLEKTTAILDWQLPDAAELSATLQRSQENLPSVPVTWNGGRERVVQALQGLTEFEARSVILNAVASTKELGECIIPLIIGEKKQIIRKSGVLEYYEANTSMKDVGGLQHLKKYAKERRSTFSDRARADGIEHAKGVLLVGVPGTGKSLSAKAMAGSSLPLLRMDVGALMGSLVGESEKNMRAALKVAEAVAPAVLWIDEIEKSLGGSGGEHDGGTSARVLGTLLTWMQENTAPLYIVATANDVRQLRPELIRRFDDTFWVDLPGPASREDILKVHMEKRGLRSQQFDIDKIVRALRGFTGAEIEKTVKEARISAFVDEREVTEDDLLYAASLIVPISRTMKSQIDDLRQWAADRCRVAGEPFDERQSPTTQPAGAASVEMEM